MDSLTVMEGAFNDLNKSKHKRTASKEHCTKDILLNVVVEQSAANDRQQQMVRMLGFVVLDELDTKLSDVRLKMMHQLDDEQLHVTGTNFKFLNKTFPISSKQESLLSVKRILMDLTATAATTPMHTKKRSSRLLLEPHMHHPNIKVDRPSSARSRSARSKKDSLVMSPNLNAKTINLSTNANVTAHRDRENPFLRDNRSTKKTPQALQEEETDDDDDSEPGHGDGDGHDDDVDQRFDDRDGDGDREDVASHLADHGDYDDDDDDEEDGGGYASYNDRVEQLQTLETVPHHYRYMSARRQNSFQLTSPVVTAANHPSSQSRPASVCGGDFLGEPHSNAVEYRQVKISGSGSRKQQQQQQHEHGPYTIMVRANHHVMQSQNQEHKSTVFAANAADKQTAGAGVAAAEEEEEEEEEEAMESDEPSNALPDDRDGMDEHLIAPRTIGSPKNTRLEVQCGEKLPRIRSQERNAHNLAMAHEVGGLLHRSQVRLHGLDAKQKQRSIDVREDSISLSFSDLDVLNSASTRTTTTTTLATAKTTKSKSKSNHAAAVLSKTKSFLKQPPHTFMYFNINAAEHGDGEGADSASGYMHVRPRRRDRQQTRFTVIGSPILRQHGNRKHTMDVGGGGSGGNNNVVWQFSKETDLIKGLSGVHHNRSNPLWIDLVCGADAFMNIAEHIRPSIHKLTMEDCVSADCREKMEIFRDYVFLCVKTSSAAMTTTTAGGTGGAGAGHTPSIYLLVFETMILTLHDGTPLTTQIVAHCRQVLHKKFGNMCPSPAWVCYTILDAVIDRMIPDIESTVREVEVCERFIFGGLQEDGQQQSSISMNQLLQRMQIARAWMVLYRSRLYPKSTITHNLLNNEFWRKQFFKDVPQPYWADINDHVARMVDLLELGTQTLESVQNVFVAKVSLEMTQKSNNLSMVGEKLARVGAVFMPLTVITGIWGMNCKVPFQLFEDGQALFTNDHYGFCIIMGVMVVAAWSTWAFVTHTSRKGQEKALE